MSNLPAVIEPIRVVACPHPFRAGQKRLDLVPGESLLEILRQVQPDISAYSAHVWVNDDYVKGEDWENTYPKPGSNITIRVIPQGGVGRIIGMVFLAIAVIAVTVLTAGALGPAGFGLMSAGWAGFVGGLAGSVVGIVGGMILNALIPPTTPQRSQMALLGSRADSPTYSLTGAGNQPNLYGPISVVLGKYRMYPFYGAELYTEIVGDNQYLRVLFVWGISRLGTPAIQIEDLKIGTTTLDNFEEVEIEHRNLRYKDSEGNTTDYGNDPLTLYTNDIHEDPESILLEQNEPQTRSTLLGAAESSIDVTLPQGMYATDPNTGVRYSKTVDIKIEIRLTGSGDDYVQVVVVPETSTQDWIDNSIEWDPQDSGSPPEGYTIVYLVFTKDGLMSSGYFATTMTIPVSLRVTANTTSAVRRSVRFNLNTDGPYDIRLTRLTSPDGTYSSSASYWSAIRSVNYTSPFQCPVPCAVTVLRIKATNQLHGTVDRFSGIVTSICLDWNSDSGVQDWVMRTTQNPASLFRYLCQGNHKQEPIPDARIDLEKLQEWHEFCDDKGYQYDKVIDYKGSLKEGLDEIAAAGRAAFSWIDNKVGVIIDRPQEFVVGPAWTPRNSANMSSMLNYPDMPHAFRVPFKNANIDYKDDERIVPADGYAILNSSGLQVDAWGNLAPTLPLATKFEQIELPGQTNPDNVFKLARYHLAVAKIRYETTQWDTDILWLVATRGDRIKRSDDVMLVGLCSGRVKALIMETTGGIIRFGTGLLFGDGHLFGEISGEFGETGNLAGVEVDEPCPMQIGLTYCIRFVLSDNTSLLKTVQVFDPSTTELYFITPMEPYNPPTINEKWPAVGDLFMFGESDKESIDFILKSIQPKSDMRATVVAVPYDENIYLADVGTIPDHDPKISIPTEWWTPIVDDVRSDGTVLWRDPDGSWQSRILVTLGKRSAMVATIAGVELQYWQTDSGQAPIFLPLSSLDVTEISIMPVDDGVSYDFRLRYVKQDGSRGPWSDVYTHVVIGKTAPPSNVENFNLIQVRELITASWTEIQDKDLFGYEIRFGVVGISWDNASVVNGSFSGTTFTTTEIPAGTWDVMIKAIDTSKNYSLTATRKMVVIVQFYNILSGYENWPVWPGTLTNFIRNPLTGNLNPKDQEPASANDFDLFNNYCINPYSTMEYEAEEIDLGEDTTPRIWSRMSSELDPGVSGTNSPVFQIDYKLDAGSYDGFENWTIGYINARYVKAKVVVTVDSFGIPLKLTGFQPVIDEAV